jgi:hypothetical protein
MPRGVLGPLADRRDIKRFVLNCPFISARVRAPALLLLRGRARKRVKTAEILTSVSQTLEPTTRQDEWITLEVTQVLFFGTLGGDSSYTRPLLRNDRGYDVGNERELSQVARKMRVGGGHDVLHVAALWCLSLGPGMCRFMHE